MNNVTEGASILEQEETMVGKSKGPYYKMKIEGHGWLAFDADKKTNPDLHLSVCEDENDPRVTNAIINKSTKSYVKDKAFYTWAFYPYGKSGGLRLDYHSELLHANYLEVSTTVVLFHGSWTMASFYRLLNTKVMALHCQLRMEKLWPMANNKLGFS
ncbi:hypothetical protein ACOMICROBIO_LKFPLAJE_00939 [Vibrio sp. B1FIG11]|uniref:hypothetical protein n=1 Tax=Vibrio sp. B1FIG11 TaxID=2751177 RepID=UPI001AF600C3|nr:hypothetical protein [Vibrio sp. B1FIG11]CAE6892941.1 hypothetical protein ACOMICROBIO_LKFPLAJE_00939 [Vibrio sp. B1FIG11]